jgi:hypothetical protein
MKLYSAKRTRSLVILGDILLIVVSIFIAWLIRSRFSFFQYKLENFLMSLPYVLLLRVLANILFEHYSLSFRNLYLSDLTGIFRSNLIPSIVFLAIRLLSPDERLRLPISMIFTEYLMTSTGMGLLRLVLYNAGRRRGSPPPGERKALLVGDMDEIQYRVDPAELGRRYRLIIESILTRDRMHWNTDHRGVRVLGGLESVETALDAVEHWAVLVCDGYLRFDERIDLLTSCAERGKPVFLLRDGELRPIYLQDIARRMPPDILPVPGSVLDGLRGRSMLLIGRESAVCSPLQSAAERGGMRVGTASAAGMPPAVTGSGERWDFVVDLTAAVWCESHPGLTFPFESVLEKQATLARRLGNSNGGHALLLSVIPVPTTEMSRPEEDSGLPGSILLTGGIVPALARVPASAFSNWAFWELPEEVAGYVLKVLALSGGTKRWFFCRSAYALRPRELRRLALLGGLLFDSENAGAGEADGAEPPDDPAPYRWQPTEYHGLFREKEEKRP